MDAFFNMKVSWERTFVDDIEQSSFDNIHVVQLVS